MKMHDEKRVENKKCQCKRMSVLGHDIVQVIFQEIPERIQAV